MKAVSPMVAIVLLIAATIGIGGLVSIFVTGLTTTSTGITSNASESQIKCAGSIKVERVTTDIIIYYNPTHETITGITGVTSDGSSINITGTGSSSLTPGQTAIIKNTTQTTDVTNETINFVTNGTYYSFSNTPVTSVSQVANNTFALVSSNYTFNTTHIALTLENTSYVGNYNVSYVYNITVRTFSVGTNTSVILRGLCQTLVTVEGSCKQGQECWKP